MTFSMITDLASFADPNVFIGREVALLATAPPEKLFLDAAAFVVLLLFLAVGFAAIEPRPRPRTGSRTA